MEKEYQKKGLVMKRSKIERNLLEKASAEFLETKKQRDDQRLINSRSTRQAHYEKTYKKK